MSVAFVSKLRVVLLYCMSRHRMCSNLIRSSSALFLSRSICLAVLLVAFRWVVLRISEPPMAPRHRLRVVPCCVLGRPVLCRLH